MNTEINWCSLSLIFFPKVKFETTRKKKNLILCFCSYKKLFSVFLYTNCLMKILWIFGIHWQLFGYLNIIWKLQMDGIRIVLFGLNYSNTKLFVSTLFHNHNKAAHGSMKYVILSNGRKNDNSEHILFAAQRWHFWHSCTSFQYADKIIFCIIRMTSEWKKS